ncbi:hypothetical protein TNCV_4095381 [Trichonephila clavipes]|uniref:Uncharacterized protein n=1 Tax=Trichonephila clavipes TaxID=2585209 RepID=A0A8X6SIP2_TRICX|nr:hypothetical protein TNCV_4095381 [Trichonephila clavipes]
MDLVRMILSKGVQAAPAAFYPLSRNAMFMVLEAWHVVNGQTLNAGILIESRLMESQKLLGNQHSTIPRVFQEYIIQVIFSRLGQRIDRLRLLYDLDQRRLR